MVYVMWMVMPVVLMALMMGYLFWTCIRTLRFFTNVKKAKTFSAVLVIVAVLPALWWTMWIIVLLHFVGISLVVDLVYTVLRRLNHGSISKEKRQKIEHVVRYLKGIYYSKVAVLVVVVAFMIYGTWNMSNVVIHDYSLESSKQMREEGYRVAMLADLHFGTTMDAEKLQQEADKIEAQNPDVLILAGDIVDESTTKEEMQDAFRILGEIDTVYGVYFVYGNHDRQLYSDEPYFTIEEEARSIRDSGITILQDQSISIGGNLILVGREDRSVGSRLDPQTLMQQAGDTSDKTVIFVDHQPCEYTVVDSAGADFILSGHTHAGQVWPAGVLARVLHFDDLGYGYESLEHLQAVVTSGIAGWEFPFRTEKHSEVVMLQIQEG